MQAKRRWQCSTMHETTCFQYILIVMYLAILGRQPSLGLAELERVFGSDKISPINQSNAAQLHCQLDSSILKRLGGTTKLAKIFTTIDGNSWPSIEKEIINKVPSQLLDLAEGKIRVGISTYGLEVNIQSINITALKLKRVVKKSGRSIRVVPNKSSSLNSAQVIHNQLTGPSGFEIVAVRSGKKTIIAQTTAEQDIYAYSSRDQARPYRDAFVGMLPPKLAQMMVNLAEPTKNGTVLDPFCGTGVVLQEAALLGFSVYGTDLSEKMVHYSQGNLTWLQEQTNRKFAWQLDQADATSATWKIPIDAIVSETYLGQPFSAPPSPEKLQQVRGNCNHIISQFLQHIAPQLNPGTPLCLAVPAWRDKEGKIAHLSLLNDLVKLGYSRTSLTHVKNENLIYFRPNQIVARELLLLIKN